MESFTAKDNKIDLLSDKVKEFVDLLSVRETGIPGTVDLITQSGSASLIGIWNSREFSIAKFITAPNTSMEWHTHSGLETFQIYTGELIMFFNDQTFQRAKYGYLYIPESVPHCMLSSPLGCRAIAVMLPGSPDFPQGLNQDW